MRIMSGYIPPSAGEVNIGGFDIVDQSLDVRRIVGYLPESVPLYPEMTVFEFLYFMANLRHIKGAEDRVYEVLDLVKMVDRSEGYISKLSKGMRQRIGLAQALLHHPDVLILDEPTIGLDPAQILEVRKLIREIGKEHTVLLSTHILPEAQQVCNRIIIINKGQIVAEDTTEHLQRLISGTQKVKARLRGDMQNVLSIVNKTKGVIQGQFLSENIIEFEVENADEVSPIVVKALVQSGIDILELQPSSLSLEDIFLQLTNEETISEEQVTEG